MKLSVGDSVSLKGLIIKDLFLILVSLIYMQSKCLDVQTIKIYTI